MNQLADISKEGWQEAKRQKESVDSFIRPYYQSLRQERLTLTEEYQKEIIRKDNYHLRYQFVRYSTFGIFAVSYLMSKRGSLRYSLRNAFLFYALTTALVCPESLNPFNKKP
jgi:hypothetical protein